MNGHGGSRRWLPSATVVALAAMFLALIVLVFSTGGSAVAAGKKQLLTTATGSFTTPVAGEGLVPLELANASFTQEAGATILAVIKLDWAGEPPPFEGTACQVQVLVGIGDAFAVEVELTNGGFSPPPPVHGIVPAGSAVPLSVEAAVSAPTSCDTDGVTFNLTVAVVAVG